MSDCFTRGLACSSMHTCNRNGCQRKATGFDPADRQAVDFVRRAEFRRGMQQGMSIPNDLLVYMLRDLKRKRAALDGFISLGNELGRAAQYERWIEALNEATGAPLKGGDA